MGVPGFIYWLITNVIDSASEKKKNGKDDSVRIVYPIANNQTTVEKVIGERVDNFYIDLNGLIHPCCHPQIGKKPENEDEMMQRITDELLHLARTVTPKNVFYIAVDGVAPAAKQEQQRHRRFVAIGDNEQKATFFGRVQQEILKEKDELKGAKDDTNKSKKVEEELKRRENTLDVYHARMESKKHHWDHNVISPGTPFMVKCMGTVHKAAKLIVTEFPHMKVIVSDSSIPGEGEHKILSYMKKEKAINSQKFSEMVHVVHGLDADLIMLTSLIGLPKMYSYRDSESNKTNKREKELFYISELGRYFSRVIYSCLSELDRSSSVSKIEWSNENFVSDVVLLLMFVGNDFLPNVPSLVMHNHAASLIMYSYAKYLLSCLNESGTAGNFDPKPHYIVDYSSKSMINIKNMVKAMSATREESVIGLFAKLYHSTLRAYNQTEEDIYANEDFVDQLKSCYASNGVRDHILEKLMKTISRHSISHKTYDVVVKILGEHFTMKTGRKINSEQVIQKCFFNPANVIHEIDTQLILKYSEEIHAEYYQKKFQDSSKQFRKNLVKEYLRGIVWTFNYYSFNEPPSWYWRYPFHYAPVMCDVLDVLEELDEEYITEITTFEKGEPLSPYQQLVSILPKESMEICLPKTYTEILNNPKLDAFFPKKFEKDGNFTGIAYKAVSLLPSIDIDLVKNITKEIDPLLTEEEKKKNSFGIDLIYTAVDSDVNAKLSKLKPKEQKEFKFNDNSTLSGIFTKIDQDTPIIFGSESIQDEFKPTVTAYRYDYPTVPIADAYKHVATAPIPKGKLICTLTRQIKGFNELGGFVSMSEHQDLGSLRASTGNSRRQRKEVNKRKPEEDASKRPSKAPKKVEEQKTPLETKPEEKEEKPGKKIALNQRKPIKAKNRNEKKSSKQSKQTESEKSVNKVEKSVENQVEKVEKSERPSKKANHNNKGTKGQPAAQSSSISKPVEAVETKAEQTDKATSEVNETETKRKRKRNRQKNKKKKLNDGATETITETTPSTAPVSSSAPLDTKQKMKESTNAKFKALLGKFVVKKD